MTGLLVCKVCGAETQNEHGCDQCHATNTTTERLAEIEARWAEATPGPWAWHGNERNHNVYLIQEYGQTVMALRRWGMQKAQPAFTVNHFLKAASDMLETDHNGVIWSMNHPDARAIAAAPDDVAYLLAELRAAREVIAWYADTKNYTDDTIDFYTSGIPGHSQQVNHPLDPEDWDWIPDRGKRARAYLNRDVK